MKHLKEVLFLANIIHQSHQVCQENGIEKNEVEQDADSMDEETRISTVLGKKRSIVEDYTIKKLPSLTRESWKEVSQSSEKLERLEKASKVLRGYDPDWEETPISPSLMKSTSGGFSKPKLKKLQKLRKKYKIAQFVPQSVLLKQAEEIKKELLDS